LHFIGDRTHVFSRKHFIRSAGRSASTRGGGASKEKAFGAERGGSQGGEIFLSPPSCAFFRAFFAQAKKAEFPKQKRAESITRQIRRFAGDGSCRGHGLTRAFHTLGVADAGNVHRREMKRFFGSASE